MTPIESIQGFFFDTMVTKSWANGDKGEDIPGMPGWQQIVYEANGLRLVDQWGKDAGGCARGIMIIYDHGVPAWHKRLRTETPDENYTPGVLPFLKSALMENYSSRVFEGGRGPRQFVSGDYRYINLFEGDFLDFSAHETIVTRSGAHNRGSHFCKGGSLLEHQWRHSYVEQHQ